MWLLSMLVRFCLMLDYHSLSCVLTKSSFYHLGCGCTQIFRVCVNVHKLQTKLSREWGRDLSARSCCGTMKVTGFQAFGCGGPEPGEEQGVGSSGWVRFPWAGEEEQDRDVNALCVSAPCIHSNADKGLVFLSVFDLSGHLSLSSSLTVCLSSSVGNTTSWIWGCGTVAALCLSGREMKTHPDSWE